MKKIVAKHKYDIVISDEVELDEFIWISQTINFYQLSKLYFWVLSRYWCQNCQYSKPFFNEIENEKMSLKLKSQLILPFFVLKVLLIWLSKQMPSFVPRIHAIRN